MVVHQTQPEEEQVLSEIEIKRLFENFDTDHDGLVSFLDFRTAVTEHLQHHNGIRSLLDTDVQTAASGRYGLLHSFSSTLFFTCCSHLG